MHWTWMQYDNTVEGSGVVFIQQGQLSKLKLICSELEIAMGCNLIQIYIEEVSQEPNWTFFPWLLLSDDLFKVWFKFLRNN